MKKKSKSISIEAVPFMDKNSDRDWRAECDAMTLIDAENIKADPKKLAKAIKAAKKIATEKTQEAKAAKKISNNLKASMSLSEDED